MVSIYAYFKYNSYRLIAVGLIEIGKKNFNIKTSSWKTFPLIWSLNMLFSSIKCCCSIKDCCCSCNRRNETGAENVPLVRTATDDSATNHGSVTNAVKLSLLVDMDNISPSGKWKEQIKTNLPKEAQNKFNEMLVNCIAITNVNFLKHFQKYASFSLNRHSSYCRHPLCIKGNHAEFNGHCCLTDSIFYYGVLDWNNLRLRNKSEGKVKHL